MPANCTTSSRIHPNSLENDLLCAGKRIDSPRAALVQGLRYAAIANANRRAIAEEENLCLDRKIGTEAPVVLSLAPTAWWLSWLQLAGSTGKAAGTQEPIATGVRNREREETPTIMVRDIHPDNGQTNMFGRRKKRRERGGEFFVCKKLARHRPAYN